MGGYGHRTSTDAYPELSALTETPVIALKLVNPRFYHLDTCFLPLSEDTVMICAEAFDERGLSLIRTLFPNVLQVPEDEAVRYFTLNAHVLDLDGKRYAILQQGAQTSIARLKELAFTVIELDTSEFMKSGGSVFCMKMMYP